MAIHSRGLAGMIPRGEDNTRIYLQIPLGDTAEDWTDDRIWRELAERFGTEPTRGPILSSQVVPLRNVVYEPMQHENLFLVGDAAHIVPPMSAKGINLALNDTDVLATALIAKITDGDDEGLAGYSDTALQHVWNYQAFATWINDLMHDAGDHSYAGEFRKQIARAELQRQFSSPAANQLFTELTSGVN
jgi:p-hydroxybenzoate 3-monooxygenase